MNPRFLVFLPLLIPINLCAEVDFSRDIRPLLNAKCTACHGGVKEAGEVSFIYRDKVLGKGESGKPVVVPGKPEQSELIQRVISQDPEEVMPKPEHGPRLSEAEVALLRQWIQEGAKWGEHWSFVAPVSHPAPQVSNPGWCRTSIDPFILARLDAEGLKPSKEADRSSLLRRVSLDLTGLPPTLEELDAFQADVSPDAYEKQVDRLLASPAFGERWASVWMDLARYADSEGLGLDRRRDSWKYRDWLIQSFNEDKPFDRFTLEQLAGDLIPGATLDQRIATTFHRLSQSNEEGGTDDEEFRITAMIDRVNTTWEVWMGQTFGCVQCHSHPYDPIHHEEYYRFAAFFNQTRDADLSESYPVIRVPLDRGKHEEAGKLQDAIRAAESEWYGIYRNILETTSWSPVTDLQVNGGKTKLVTVTQGGFQEFRTEGVVSTGSTHQLSFVPPTGEAFTAVRLELLPLDEKAAKVTPEWGSFLRKVELKILDPAGAAPRIVEIAGLLGDEEHPFFDPEESLRGGHGWGPYSKIDRVRWCVIIPKTPLALAPGERLQLSIAHGGTIISSFPMVSKRGRLSVSTDSSWAGLLAQPNVSGPRARIVQLRRQLAAIPSTTVPVMEELENSHRRETHVFIRGNWLDKGPKIQSPDVPVLFPKLPVGKTPDRLTMAEWLVSPQHPLTARVAVNRLWLELFGTGLVETPEDFGSSGTAPSHPDLLDDLAVRFRSEFRWSIKKTLREIATSATYRQSAVGLPEAIERDRSNRLLSRGPRQRLTAEMARDHALSVSGLLNHDLFGAPSYPPIPDSVWKPFVSDSWNTPGPGSRERYRRSVYTYWKRSIPYPSFSSFDAPTRELCSKRRIVSNTPLQALTILNDPAFDECSRALAIWMDAFPESDVAGKISNAYRRVTSRAITPDRLERLITLYRKTEETFTIRPDPKAGATPSKAAFNVVASVVMNLDEALVR